jgi:hypothetical protein
MWLLFWFSCTDKIGAFDAIDSGFSPSLDTGATIEPESVRPVGEEAVWVSTHRGYGTGGGFADIDRDGDEDLVVSHGNDMDPGHLVVFENLDGTLSEEPSWLSAETAYYGHLSIGDVNGDGFPDVAVSRFLGDARFDEPGGLEVYLNRDGVLESRPSWSVDGFFSFSLDLGDVDGDGDLDLGVAVGEAYRNDPDYARMFLNDGTGQFGEDAAWMSAELGHSFDVSWADMDGDGQLDLAFAEQGRGHRIYRNEGGVLSAYPWWSAAPEDGPFEGNTLDVGDVNGDGYLDLAVSDNDQLGGAGAVRVWCGPDLSLCWEVAQPYASAVEFEDYDLDGDLDLAYGGWWAAVQLVENVGGRLATEPLWTSAKDDIVVEAIEWADVDGDGLPDLMTTDWTESSGNRLWSR